MKPVEEMEFYAPAEKIVEILCKKTQNTDPLFFRISTSFYLTKIASMMRAKVLLLGKDAIPVNMYALNLESSGMGKGMSTNILEDQVIGRFKDKFLEELLPKLAETNANKLANAKAVKNGTDPDGELELISEEYRRCGPLLFSFDSGTTPALKQMREKLLMAAAGSLNLHVDEIGSNLLNNAEILVAFLELFDLGLIKAKLIKNTKENQRVEEIKGHTPANMLLFGTPAKLLNGSKVEDEFYSMLETGYARRCFFGYNKHPAKKKSQTAEELYDLLNNNQNDNFIVQFAGKLEKLADPKHFDKVINMPKSVSLVLLDYQLHCRDRAEKFKEHEEIKKTEMEHRYFKAMKLAGTYAFIDGKSHMTEQHMYSAIKLAELSGVALHNILNKPPKYERLARYIADIGKEVTHADIQHDLPMYKGEAHRRELMTLAIAYGYKNNIIIKKTTIDDVDLFTGESLKETDLNSMIFSYSADITRGYVNQLAKWDELHKLAEASGIHWINHHLENE